MSQDRWIPKKQRLGRVILEQDNTRSVSEQAAHYIVFGAIAAICIAGGAWVAFGKQRDLALGAFTAGVFGFGTLLLAYLIDSGRTNIIRCHEYGVSLHGRRYTEITYDEVAGFWCELIAFEIEGQYAGTRYDFTFKLQSGQRYSQQLNDCGKETLGQILQHISQALAARWVGKLHQGESIRWGSCMKFTPGGLVVAPSAGAFESRHAFTVPGSHFVSIWLHGGKYDVKAGPSGRREVVCSGAINERNFFPGRVMASILHTVPDDEPPPWGDIDDSEPKSPFDFR